MTEVIERIVAAYVKLGNRKALDDLRAHRHRLATDLKSRHGVFDLSSAIKQLEEEISAIDAGLAKLNAAAAA